MLTWLRTWRLRGRLVRLHLEASEPSVQGLYRGRRGGHYLLDVPQLIVGGGDPKQISGFVCVPCSRVLFMEVKP